MENLEHVDEKILKLTQIFQKENINDTEFTVIADCLCSLGDLKEFTTNFTHR